MVEYCAKLLERDGQIVHAEALNSSAEISYASDERRLV
jgi:hypothetical protein